MALGTVHITLLGRFEVTVDGVAVAEDRWARRHAAALVKVLALAGDRRLHREQVIDLVWPDDPIEGAAPKLHKAAHFARRAMGVPKSMVLRADSVALCPEVDTVVVDAVEFENLARRALADADLATARRAIDLYGGDLLPDDRYEPWAEDRREQLRLRYLDLLRLDDRWDEVLALDESDEAAHLALMRRHAANGDRHAALRQFERMDRVLRRELGVGPGREAVALRERLLAEYDAGWRDQGPLIGREVELTLAERALSDSSAGRSRVLIVVGPPGVGRSSLLTAIAGRAAGRNLRVGQGGGAAVEGAWPYAPVLEALADLCRRHPNVLDRLADDHREEVVRALSGGDARWTGGSSHQGLFAAAAELVRAATVPDGLLLTFDDTDDADDASLRLLQYIARSNHDERLCVVLSHRSAPANEALAAARRSLIGRQGALELELRPLDHDDVAAIVRRRLGAPSPELVERIAILSRGLPLAVEELARRAGSEPGWGQRLEAGMISGVAPRTRQALQRVAVVGSSFDTDEFVALSGLGEGEAFDCLDDALAARIVEPASAGYRFCHGLVREALLQDLPPHRRRRVHRDAAARLAALGASPARIGHHFLEAGANARAVPYLLRAAESEAAVGAYRDALALVEAVRPHATAGHRTAALRLRADLLNALGDPAALPAYRDALDGADAGTARHVRVRLASCALMSGDLDTAAAALDGLDTDGGPDDADILLARGKCAFFSSDFQAAQAAADQAQQLLLAGQHSWKVLDLVTLQGMLAHRADRWFDRMCLELRRTRDRPEIANAVFDGSLCAAEYLLYGPMPYGDVMDVARQLQATARRSGAQRAAAFASALIGEAALLSGRLDLASAELADAGDLHREVGSAAGEAHSLQRLAEVRLAQGDADGATALLQRALPLARGSLIARHLLDRIYGTMILAAPDATEARAVVDQAESVIGWDDVCPFCSIFRCVPAAIACARAGDVDAAQRHLAMGERSASLWQGTAWEGRLAEARAAVALAQGDRASARRQMRAAVEAFERAGQPLDADRCRRASAEG